MLNNTQYNIAVEGEAANILSHFSDQYVLDVIENNMGMRLTNYLLMVNLVSSLETNFMYMLDVYPHNSDDIKNKREDVYDRIIKIICTTNNLEYTKDDFSDNKESAYYLYEFFISSFRKILIDLFTSIILKEKNNIYNTLEMNALKRKKDSSTTYGKKRYNNVKMAVIAANLEDVLEYVFSLDITFDDILNIIYSNKNIIKHLESIVSPRGDIYKDLFVTPFKMNPMMKVELMVDIRLNINKILTTNANQ